MTKTKTIDRVAEYLFGGFSARYSDLKHSENRVETAAFDFAATRDDDDRRRVERFARLENAVDELARAVESFRENLRKCREAIDNVGDNLDAE